MTKHHRWLPSRSLLFTALVAAAAACLPSEGSEPDAAAAAAADTSFARIINVRVTPVTTSDFTGYLSIAGEVQAYREVTVAADEGGRIARFLVEKGSPVRRGQVVAQIDDTVLAAVVAEARAQAQLQQERFERQRRLWEDEGIGTDIAYLEAKYNAAAVWAQLTTLEARLDRAAIKSPITGVVGGKFLEAGEYAGVGDPVFRVVTTNPIKVVGGVPERFAPDVATGDTARITFDVFPGEVYYGRISFVGATLDPASRTFPVEAVIENPGQVIKPRMIANIDVRRASLSDVIVVPRDVVVRSATGHMVFVVDGSAGAATASARAVTLGQQSGNTVVIREGLAVGDRLITTGHQMVDDGSRVRVLDDESSR